MNNYCCEKPPKRVGGRGRVRPGLRLLAVFSLLFGALTGVSTAAAKNDGFYTVTPCRVVDTRNPNGPVGGPALVANSDRAFPIQGQCGIPGNATSVVFNTTVTQPTMPGNLRLYPSGLGTQLSSSINYGKNQTRANNGTYALGADGKLGVRC